MNWFKRLIYGKYMDEVADLSMLLRMQKAANVDVTRDRNHWKNEFYKQKTTVDKIEAEYASFSPQHLHEFVQNKLVTTDKPYFEYQTAFMPLIVQEEPGPIYSERKVVKLETMIRAFEMNPIGSQKENKHRMITMFTREVADQVYEQLMKDAGWRA